MKFDVTLVNPSYWGLKKRDYQNIGRAAIQAAGLLWHRRFKSLHFQKFAYGRYGYHKRHPKWEAMKKRLNGEARPLVFTGESEHAAMSAEKVKARSPSFERYVADVVIAGPKLNFHAAEMTRVIATEERAMEAEFARTFEKELITTVLRKGGAVPLAKAG